MDAPDGPQASRGRVRGWRCTDRPALAAAAGAACIASSATLVRLADVEPATAATFRCLYALPVLGLLMLREDRRYGTPPRAGPLARRRRRRVLRASTWCSGTTRSPRSAPASPPCSATCRWSSSASSPGGCSASARAARLVAAVPVVLVGVVLISGVVGAAPTATTRRSACVFGRRHLDRLRRRSCSLLRHGSRDLRRAAGPLFDATAVGAPSSASRSAPSPAASTWCRRWPAHGWLVLLALTSQVRRLAADRGLAAAGAGRADLGDPAAAAGRVGGARPRSCWTSGRRRCSCSAASSCWPGSSRPRPGAASGRPCPAARPSDGRRRGLNLTVRGIGRLLTMVGRAAGRRRCRGPRRPGRLDRPRPRPAGRRPGRRRWTPAGACVVPGFVDAHTHLRVRRASGATSSSRGWPGTPYDGGGIRDDGRGDRRGVRRRAARPGRRPGRRPRWRTAPRRWRSRPGYGLTARVRAAAARR